MNALMHQLGSGQLTAITIAVWTLLSLVLSVVGGAMAGVVLAGTDLGNSLAAMMGAMFGPVAATPGILVALALVHWI